MPARTNFKNTGSLWIYLQLKQRWLTFYCWSIFLTIVCTVRRMHSWPQAKCPAHHITNVLAVVSMNITYAFWEFHVAVVMHYFVGIAWLQLVLDSCFRFRLQPPSPETFSALTIRPPGETLLCILRRKVCFPVSIFCPHTKILHIRSSQKFQP